MPDGRDLFRSFFDFFLVVVRGERYKEIFLFFMQRRNPMHTIYAFFNTLVIYLNKVKSTKKKLITI